MAYTTQTKVEDYTQSSLSGIVSLNSWIAAVKLYIDKYCGKTFEISGDTTRYFDGNGKDRILVDSLISITTIQILDNDGNVETTLGTTDYILYPLNETEKNEVRLTGDSAVAFTSGNKRLKIVGQFGNAASVPDDISLAATMLVAECVSASAGGTKKSESLGDYSVTYDFLTNSTRALGIDKILDQYRDLPI